MLVVITTASLPSFMPLLAVRRGPQGVRSTTRMALQQNLRVQPQRAEIEHLERSVLGFRTEILRIASTGSPQLRVLVVPGNPGCAPFYKPFMSSLHHALGGRAEVLCVSHLGMDRQGWTPPDRLFHLDEQIEHKVALLRGYQGPGQPPVALISHSIGCFMSNHAVHRLEFPSAAGSRESRLVARALDDVAEGEAGAPKAWESEEAMRLELNAALQREQKQEQLEQHGQQQQQQQQQQQPNGRQPSNVVKVISLFPFFTVDPHSAKQQSLRRLTRHHRLLGSLAAALAMLPESVKRAGVRLFDSKMAPHAVETSAALVNPASVEQAFYLGRVEFEELAAPADWWLLRQLGDRAVVITAPGDTWFPTWQREQMLEEAAVEHLHEPEMTHAFCVSLKQSAALAARIAGLLEPVWLKARL